MNSKSTFTKNSEKLPKNTFGKKLALKVYFKTSFLKEVNVRGHICRLIRNYFAEIRGRAEIP
jgi:hypothetical protein